MRKWIARLALTLIAPAIALFLAAAPGPASADFSVLDMKNSLVQFLLRQIGTPGAFEVTAGEVTEPEPGVTALNDVRIADGDGVWLTVRQVSFSWTPSALLSGRVEIDFLRISGLRMTRLSGDPELEGGELAENPPSEGFSWPRSPIPLAVKSVELRDAYLSDKVLPQAIAFDADGAVTDEGDAQVLKLAVRRTDGVSGRIGLSYDRRFGANTLALKLEAEEAAGGLVATAAGLPEGSASRVSLSAEGPPTDWKATLSASSDRVFALTGGASISYEGPIAADVDLRLEAGESLDPALRRALSPDARLVGRLSEGGDGVIRIEEAFLRAADLDLRIDGRYGRNDGALDFVLAGEARRGLSDLANGAAFERVSIDGRLKGLLERFDLTGEAAIASLTSGPVDLGAATLQIALAKDEERVDLQLDGQASRLRVDRLGPEVFGEARLAFDGALAGGQFSIKDARLESNLIRASASGGADLNGERFDVSYAVEANDLAPALAAYGLDGAGAARIEGGVAGPFADLAAKGEARVAALRVDGEALGDAVLTHDLSIAEATSGGVRFSLEGGVIGPAKASLTLRSDDEGLTLSDISAEALGATLRGNAEIDGETGLATARLALDAPDLRPLGRTLDQPLSGGIGGDLIAEPREGRQAVAIDLAADRLSLDARRFASGPVRVTLDDVESGQGLDAGLRWRLARIDGAKIGSASLYAKGALDAFEFDAAATLKESADPLAASLKGGYRREGDGAALRLDVARAAFGEGEKADVYALAEPLLVSLREGAASFEKLAVSLPRGGAIEARLAHAGEDGVALDASVDGLDLGVIGKRFDAPVSGGSLDASLALDTRPGRASGTLRAKAAGLKVAGANQPIDAAITGDWDGMRAALAVDAAAKGGARPLAVTLQTPLRAAPGGGIEAPKDEPIEGSVSWSGDIGDFWPLVPAPDHLVTGRAEIDLKIGGVLGAPKVSGRIALDGGRYENLAFGTILENVTVRSQIEDGSNIRLDLDARAGQGGATADVSLDLAAEGGPRIAARSRLRGALLARSDDLTATLSGEIAADGPLAAPKISGRLQIDEAEVRLITPAGAEIADLGPVRPAGAPEPTKADREAARLAARGPELDLTIDGPRKIFTRGRGLDAEWRAALTVAGYAASPIVTGTIEKLRGRLDLLGRRFDLTRGEVVFSGAEPPDPSLDLVFTREANDVEGRVEISGNASEPKLAFASTPALPEQEVLPRVLFGRAKQSLSAAEAAQLASGVATLMSGEAGLLDRARSLTGLDVLDYGETRGGGDAVTAGRYVGEGVFVGAKQPLDGKGGSAVVEIEVFEGISIDAEVGRDQGSSAGATWKFDF